MNAWNVESEFSGNRSALVGNENIDVHADLNGENEAVVGRLYCNSVDQIRIAFDLIGMAAGVI